MHFLTLKNHSTRDILGLIKRSLELKSIIRNKPLSYNPLPPSNFSGKTMAMIFSKKSTRTRVSAESGWSYFNGYPLFLSGQDIQLSGGEPMLDTSKVVSSMVDLIFARLGAHSEIEGLAEHSSVPVINALTAKYHPLQILADLMTLYEVYMPNALASGTPLPPLPKLKIAWVGDANNIVNSMLVTYPRLGLDVSVATPPGYDIEPDVAEFSQQHEGKVTFYKSPLDAVENADVIVTDTWISMGQESEKEQRIKDFAGFMVTEKMAASAKKHWKFMHCLPRKQYEVDDQVFYNPKRSVVFQEAENRKYTVMAVFEFLMNRKH